MGDIATSLKALIEAGRGSEPVEFKGRIKGLKEELSGTVQQVYPAFLAFARETLQESIAEVAAKVEKAKLALSPENRLAVAEDDPITPAAEAQIQAWVDKVGAETVSLRRELLPSGEFAPEVEKLNDLVAQIAALVQEPLPIAEAGAGKVHVLEERRLARDADEVRDLPLRDKIARLNDPQASWQETNADARDVIRSLTGKPLVKAIEEILDKDFPELMKAFYPRVYENTGRYASPRSCAAMIANVVAEMLRYGYHKAATAYRLLMPGLSYLCERRMPMFFLAPDLLEAVLRTDFDDDINWTELSLPYESGILILPKGALVHPEDGEVSMLIWARVAKGDHPSPWPGIPRPVLPNDCFIILGACPEKMIWYDSILTANVRPVMRLHNLFYRESGQPVPAVGKSSYLDSDLSEKDAEFLEKMGVVVFGTILAMNARPTLVEHGKLVKRVGKGDKAREFWSPNVIGARYKFKREVARVVEGRFVTAQREHGTHASPRLHWRRGHYRNQPVGTGRKERKTIWIEPCLIGAELEKETKQ